MTSQVIQRLWDLLPHPDGTTIRWFAKNLDGSIKWGGFADSAAELWNAVINNEGMHFYVCPNPSSSRIGVRHKTSDVTHWSWFLLDIDPIVKTDFNPQLLMDAALLHLGEWIGRDFRATPPIIIDSGRGMQAWIRLEDVELTDETRRTARLTMRHWLEKLTNKLGEMGGCRIDTTCSDLPRPMRCPGTVNIKTGRLTSFISDSEKIFRGLASILITGVPVEKFRVDPIPSVGAGAVWQDVFVHLTFKAQDYLLHGKVEPGRHETMWHTARSLAERGLSRDATRDAIVYANMRKGPDMALSPFDVEHALDTAFRNLTTTSEDGSLEESHP